MSKNKSDKNNNGGVYMYPILIVAVLSVVAVYVGRNVVASNILENFQEQICSFYQDTEEDLVRRVEILKKEFNETNEIAQSYRMELERIRTEPAKGFKRYTNYEMQKVFGVEFLPKNDFNTTAGKLVMAHKFKYSDKGEDEKTDEEWKELSELYAPYFVDNPAPGYRMEDLHAKYYIRYSDDSRNFGIFAARDLKKGEFLDEYTGEIVFLEKVDCDYLWTYPLKLVYKNETLTVGIDSRLRGNAMRFVNDAEDSEMLNAESTYIPYGNFWRIVYIVTKNIRQDDQVFVSYGSNYWKSRYTPT